MRSAISRKDAKAQSSIQKRTQIDKHSNSVCRCIAIIAMSGFHVALPGLCVSAPLREQFLKQYCINCHGSDKQSGDRRFDKLTNEIQTPDEAMLWQEILDQLNLGEMPPKKERQPQKAELLAAVDAITQSLATATQRFKGTEAHTVLRRLNSFEYSHTIGDLVGLNVAGWNPAANFPPEVRADGFDNNLPPRDFLAADYTFLNRELALHYGLPPVEGVQLRQVSLLKGDRGGLLTQASFLTASANGVDTSPVVRGVYVQEKLLGYTPPPPPPDVPLIEPDASGATTIREQLAKHRENATCASCHQKIDPYGFALENFDAIGGWRANYTKDHKIDPSGDLPSGEKFTGVTDFRSLLIVRHEQFTRSLTEKLLTYALGRAPALADRAVIDDIMNDLSSNKGGFKDLVRAVVRSQSFAKN